MPHYLTILKTMNTKPETSETERLWELMDTEEELTEEEERMYNDRYGYLEQD